MIGVVPARGGSKRLVSKNTAVVEGVPLVVRAARTLSEVCEHVVVSTDDHDVAATAVAWGFRVEERPAEWCADNVQTDGVLRGWWRPQWPDEWIVLLQPTCPQIGADDIRLAVEQAKQDGITGGFGVLMKDHPVWTWDGPRRFRVAPETGMQIYPPGADALTGGSVSIGHRIVDIDWPEDLTAARAAMCRRRIVFRVVANRKVGSGHLHRTMQVVQELQHYDVRIEVTGDTDADRVEWLRLRGWNVAESWPDVDLYVKDTLDEPWSPPHGVPWVAFEDHGPTTAGARLVVNDMYPRRGAANEVTGPDWVVLRPEFLTPRRYEPKEGNRVLVTFGGTDPSGLTGKTVWALDGLGARVRVIAPPSGVPLPDLGGAELVSAPFMAEEMLNTDLLVCSAGRTVWEAAALGVPAVVLSQNPREASHVQLGEDYGNVFLGSGRLVEADRFRLVVSRLLGDVESRRALSERAGSLVDGRGALRIAHRIEGILGGL